MTSARDLAPTDRSQSAVSAFFLLNFRLSCHLPIANTLQDSVTSIYSTSPGPDRQ